MTTTPRILPGLIRDALDHGWNVRAFQTEYGVTLRLTRWNRDFMTDPRTTTNLSFSWSEDGHLDYSAINGALTSLAQCRALIREGATP